MYLLSLSVFAPACSSSSSSSSASFLSMERAEFSSYCNTGCSWTFLKNWTCYCKLTICRDTEPAAWTMFCLTRKLDYRVKISSKTKKDRLPSLVYLPSFVHACTLVCLQVAIAQVCSLAFNSCPSCYWQHCWLQFAWWFCDNPLREEDPPRRMMQ